MKYRNPKLKKRLALRRKMESYKKRLKPPTDNAASRSPNPLLLDPTRTQTLRRSFGSKVKGVFAQLGKRIAEYLIGEDPLGLTDQGDQLVIINVFCPTGEGGGIDPSCSKTWAAIDVKRISPDSDLRKGTGRDWWGRATYSFPPNGKLEVTYKEADKEAWVSWIGDDTEGGELSGKLGIDKLRILAQRLRQDFPNIESVRGQRVGGRRKGRNKVIRREIGKFLANQLQLIINAFCATGQGGGVDPSCGKGNASSSRSGKDSSSTAQSPRSTGQTAAGILKAGAKLGAKALKKGVQVAPGVIKESAKLLTKAVKAAYDRYGDKGSLCTLGLAFSVFANASGIATGGASIPAALVAGLVFVEARNGLKWLVEKAELGTDNSKLAFAGKRVNNAEGEGGEDSGLADHILHFLKEFARTMGVAEPDLDKEEVQEMVDRMMDHMDGKAEPVENVFCPTGEGGGIDPSCSKHQVNTREESTGNRTTVRFELAGDPRNHLRASLRPNALRIKHVFVGEGDRGQGIGMALYQSAIRYAEARGISLESDEFVAADAVKVWQALERRGYPVTRHEATPDSGGGLNAKEDKGPVFSLKRRKVNNVFCPTGEGGGVDPSCSLNQTLLKELEKIVHDPKTKAADRRKAMVKLSKLRDELEASGAAQPKAERDEDTQTLTLSSVEGKARDLASKANYGYVKVADLWKALGSPPLSQFHAALQQLWKKGILRLQEHEGRHGISDEEQSTALQVTGYHSDRATRFTAFTVNIFCATGEGGGIDPTCLAGERRDRREGRRQAKKEARAEAVAEMHGGGIKGFFKRLFGGGKKAGKAVPRPTNPSEDYLDQGALGRMARIKSKFDEVSNKVPGVQKTKAAVSTLFKGIHGRLEQRYGSKVANTIMISGPLGGYGVMAGAIALTGTPGIPVVNDLVSIAAHTAVAELGLQSKRVYEWWNVGHHETGAAILDALNLNEEIDLEAIAAEVAEEVRKGLEEIAQQYAEELQEAATDPEVQELLDLWGSKRVDNVFCPTGEGGGVDPSCSPESAVAISIAKAEELAARTGVRPAWLDIQPVYQSTMSTGRGRITQSAVNWRKIEPESIVGRLKIIYEAWTQYKDPASGYVSWDTISKATKLSVEDIAKEIKHYDQGDKGNRISQTVDRMGSGTYFKFKNETLVENALWPSRSSISYGEPLGNATFGTSAERLSSFQRWIEGQLQHLVLSQQQRDLWNRYIQEGFEKGAGRSYEDVTGRRYDAPTDAGSTEEFLRTSFANPQRRERLELVASRTFDEVKNLTEDMKNRLARVLANALVAGQSPREAAKNLATELNISRERALLIAQTELIRAHAEGQLTALETLGVPEVGALVEWTVTDDQKLCPRCRKMAGVVLKTSEARGLIPLHPRCRCAWIPAGLGEPKGRQKTTKREIERAASAADVEVEVGIRPRMRRPVQNAYRFDTLTLEDVKELLAGNARSFFADCNRDSHGYCLPDWTVLVKDEKEETKELSFKFSGVKAVKRARTIALERANSNPKPTLKEVKQANRKMDEKGAADYESDIRGNSVSRKASRQRLLKDFGNGTHCPCIYCGAQLDETTVTRDKILTARQGGRYRNENLVPACLACNKSRGDLAFNDIKWSKLKERPTT